MADRCAQELCPNWSGDGNVCPCALFGIGKFADDYDPDDVQAVSLQQQVAEAIRDDCTELTTMTPTTCKR